MKKINFNQYFLAIVAGVSLVAFTFLNTVNVKTGTEIGVKCEKPSLEKVIDEEDKDAKDKNPSINLPSIDGAKTLIVLIKKFIPAS